MADNTQQNIQVVRYLDYEGLKTLWDKISQTYLRQSDIIEGLTTYGDGHIISSERDTFIQRGEFTDTTSALSERIEDVAAAQGTNIDNDTIINKEGKLQTNLILVDDSTNHTLSIVTKKEDGSAGTVVSQWDYTQFYNEAVKDGILNKVSLVQVPSDAEPGGDRPAGTYLKFEFNTEDHTPIYVDVDDLIDVYTEGSYIKIEKTHSLDGEEDEVKISVDEIALVEYLKKDEALGITSISTHLEKIDGDIAGLDAKLVALENTLNSLNIEALREQVSDNTYNIGVIQETLKTVPTTPITHEEINALE